MIVWGHGQRLESLGQLIPLEECPACGHPTVLHLGVLKRDFRLYWIPVARWNSAFYVYCPSCSASVDVEKSLGQRVYTKLREGNRLDQQDVAKLLGVQSSAIPTGSSSTSETHTRSPGPRLTVVCTNCGQKNSVPPEDLNRARCGKCRLSLTRR